MATVCENEQVRLNPKPHNTRFTVKIYPELFQPQFRVKVLEL